MGSMTGYGLRSKKSRLSKENELTSGSASVAVEAVENGKSDVNPKHASCLILAPVEYRAEKCETFRVRCPLNGSWACYIVDKEQERIWQVLQYRFGEYTSLMTSTEVLSSTDPIYVLCPVNAFALVLAFLIKEETNSDGSGSATTGDSRLLDSLETWKSVNSALNEANDMSSSPTNSRRFVPDKEKLNSWIGRKAKEMYEKLKDDTTTMMTGVTDQCHRDVVLKLMKQQFPLELHSAISL